MKRERSDSEKNYDSWNKAKNDCPSMNLTDVARPVLALTVASLATGSMTIPNPSLDSLRVL
jgi:hypothetical protein